MRYTGLAKCFPVAGIAHGRITKGRFTTYTPRSANSRWNGIFGHRAQTKGRRKRKTMIPRDHRYPSLSHQCRVLAISRSWLYCTPKGESAGKPALMHSIDGTLLKYPFHDSRQMGPRLRGEGARVGGHPVRCLMRLTDDFKAERLIDTCIGFFNTERPHFSLGAQTPAESHGVT